MTIERRPPAPLLGVKAISFHARTIQLDDDPTSDVIRQANQWMLDHRGNTPLHVFYDRWDDDSGLAGLSPTQRLLANIYPRDDGKVVISHATATVYYEDNEPRPVPAEATWEADL